MLKITWRYNNCERVFHAPKDDSIFWVLFIKSFLLEAFLDILLSDSNNALPISILVESE